MTKIVTGSFEFDNGQPVANGTVNMKLMQDATVVATGQLAPAVVSFVLDSNGTLGSGVTMFASDELTPSNIAYVVTVTAHGGGQVYGPEFFVISGTSPINLNNLLPSANSPVVFSTAVLTNPKAEQAVTGFPLSLIALDLPEAVAPANPTSATVRLYSKSSPTEGIYFRNSAGTETGPIQALAGNAVLLNPTGTQTITGQPLTVNSGLNLAGSALTNANATGASSGNSVTSLNAQANGSAVTGTSSAVTLYTYPLPGSTVANLKGLRVNVGWIHSTGSAVVTYNLQLNGVNIAHIANSAFSGNGAWVSATVLNTGATTGTIAWSLTDFSLNQIAGGQATTLTGLAWSSSQTLQFAFTVANTDQVTPIFWNVELIQ